MMYFLNMKAMRKTLMNVKVEILNEFRGNMSKEDHNLKIKQKDLNEVKLLQNKPNFDVI